MNLIRSLFIAFSMYSKIPMPRTDWTKEAMRYAMCFFPAVGLVIGVIMYIWFSLAHDRIGTILFTCISVLLPILITGGIHLDGLLDTADALSSYKSKEEKLEILKDSHAGAFAIIVGICYFILYLGVYSEVTKEMMSVLWMAFILSRACSALSVVSFPLAKNTGLAATFSDMAVKKTVKYTMYVVILMTAIAMLMTNLKYGIVVLITEFLVFLYYYRMSLNKFGGITGDLAGFFLSVSELAMPAALVFLSFFL